MVKCEFITESNPPTEKVKAISFPTANHYYEYIQRLMYEIPFEAPDLVMLEGTHFVRWGSVRDSIMPGARLTTHVGEDAVTKCYPTIYGKIVTLIKFLERSTLIGLEHGSASIVPDYILKRLLESGWGGYVELYIHIGYLRSKFAEQTLVPISIANPHGIYNHLTAGCSLRQLEMVEKQLLTTPDTGDHLSRVIAILTELTETLNERN